MKPLRFVAALAAVTLAFTPGIPGVLRPAVRSAMFARGSTGRVARILSESVRLLISAYGARYATCGDPSPLCEGASAPTANEEEV